LIPLLSAGASALLLVPCNITMIFLHQIWSLSRNHMDTCS
jgi:hypothetical protein